MDHARTLNSFVPVLMFAGSLLLGFAILLVAVWLEHQDSLRHAYIIREVTARSQGRAHELGQTEIRYHRLRRRWRLVIHGMLAICGGLILAAGWAGAGAFWVVAWTAVFVLLLCIVMLALADAIRTQHHVSRTRNAP